MSNAEIPYEIKYPILLPSGHPLTTLVVKEAHERVYHDGVKETLTKTRSKFWIPKGRSFTRKIIHKCMLCRRFEGRPYKAPQPPPLPICRVKRIQPSYLSRLFGGFAGPIHLSLHKMAEKIRCKKVYPDDSFQTMIKPSRQPRSISARFSRMAWYKNTSQDLE